MSRQACCNHGCDQGRTCPNRMTSLHPLRTLILGALACYVIGVVGKALIIAVG